MGVDFERNAQFGEVYFLAQPAKLGRPKAMRLSFLYRKWPVISAWSIRLAPLLLPVIAGKDIGQLHQQWQRVSFVHDCKPFTSHIAWLANLVGLSWKMVVVNKRPQPVAKIRAVRLFASGATGKRPDRHTIELRKAAKCISGSASPNFMRHFESHRPADRPGGIEPEGDSYELSFCCSWTYVTYWGDRFGLAQLLLGLVEEAAGNDFTTTCYRLNEIAF